MFKDLFLDGGIAFDVASLIYSKNVVGENEFVWLTAIFLNFKHLVSLSNFL